MYAIVENKKINVVVTSVYMYVKEWAIHVLDKHKKLFQNEQQSIHRSTRDNILFTYIHVC